MSATLNRLLPYLYAPCSITRNLPQTAEEAADQAVSLIRKRNSPVSR